MSYNLSHLKMICEQVRHGLKTRLNTCNVIKMFDFDCNAKDEKKTP